jgi:diphthamide biosynthesis protein 2
MLMDFDITDAIAKIIEYQFSRVVLQFPDDLLSQSINIYRQLRTSLPDSVDIFITADSTFGGSVDDISAEHIRSDIILYFGTDISSSASIPVMILPLKKNVSPEKIKSTLEDYFLQEGTLRPDLTGLLICDPGYMHSVSALFEAVRDVCPDNLIVGSYPRSTHLKTWTPERHPQDHIHWENIGACLFTREQVSLSKYVIYIGEKKEQLLSILLRMSECNVISISPLNSYAIKQYTGSEMKEFRERYVNVMRAKDASIIGIIIGSMGFSQDDLKTSVRQLTLLIEAANKKCYCFVMGRINESKLCNFPEVREPSLHLTL